VSSDAAGLGIAAGLAALGLGFVHGIFGRSAFDRVHPSGAGRRTGWFIPVGGAVLAIAAAALSRR